LPWDDVGVVLEDRQQNFVSRADVGHSPRTGNGVDRRRGT
jgi:hypothetical protein